MTIDNLYLEKEFKGTFEEIHEVASDYECLQVGRHIIELAMARLDKDLDNEDILEEYNKLGKIVEELKEIERNYV